MALPYPAARDGDPHPVRPPGLRNLLELGDVRFLREPVLHRDGAEQSRLAGRQLVDSAEGAQPHQLRPELADSLQSLETLEGFGPRHRTQRLRVEVARQRRTAQRVEVFDFAPEQTLE